MGWIMIETVFAEVKEWFENYLKNFQFDDKNDQSQIDLKYRHSYNVCEISRDIASSLSSEENEIDTARTIGLLHDIGRFEQYKSYKTFSDRHSVDHGNLGVRIIKENAVLDNIPEKSKEIILKSIYYHNKAHLPEGLNSSILRFCKLIRDADKIDIFRVFVEHYHNKTANRVLVQGVTNQPEISENVFEKLSSGKVISYGELRTMEDLKLMQLAWVYDINYKRSLEIIKEQEYLKSIYNTMVPSDKAAKFYRKINKYLENILDHL